MKENLPEAEKREKRNEKKGEKRREKEIRGGTGIEREAETEIGREAGIGIQREAGTGTGIGREAKTGNGTGMGRRKEIAIGTTIIEIDTGIVVREGKGEEIEMMIITEVGIVTGKIHLRYYVISELEFEDFHQNWLLSWYSDYIQANCLLRICILICKNLGMYLFPIILSWDISLLG